MWISQQIGRVFFPSGALAPAALLGVAKADDGRVRLSASGTNTLLQVRGDADDDWRLQSSTNLTTWTTVTNWGTLLSGDTNAPWRSVGFHTNRKAFYRTLKTGGLYDPTLLRTINPHKWQFPTGTTLAANGYLLVWADEDGSATNGLHANFKLSKSGEEVCLSNTNSVLDHIVFGAQQADVSYGRSSANDDEWIFMSPTPGGANQ